MLIFFYKAPSKNSDLIGLAPRIEETYFFALLDCIYWWKHALRSIDSFLSRPKDILQNNVKFISVRLRFFEELATFLSYWEFSTNCDTTDIKSLVIYLTLSEETIASTHDQIT